MKKILTAMIAVIALVTLSACGGDQMMKKSMMAEPASQSSMMK